MAKHKRRMLSDADGLSGSKSRKAPKGFKVVGKQTCLRKRKGRMVLKKGCKWGRGRYKGKLLKATAR